MRERPLKNAASKRKTPEAEMSRSARMQDVAKLAGVGTMTVSRVLNGTAHVSEETSHRVYQAIERLQYKPNQVARALRGSSSKSIGVLVPYLYDPFFATCAHAIDEVAKDRGFSVILTTTNEDAKIELDAVRQMIQRHVDGLIVIPAEGSSSNLTSSEFRDLPIVTLDRPVPQSTFDSVEAENKSAGVLAVNHLVSHGHRRIAFIRLHKQLFTMKTRYAGYKGAMNDAGLKVEAHFDCMTQAIVTDLMKALWARRDRPTALFTTNGLTTRYTLQALADLGLSIPKDMALVGFDDVDLAELMRPPLTIIRQPVTDLGRTAAELLFKRLNRTAEKDPPQHITLPVELVLRSSCGCVGRLKPASSRSSGAHLQKSRLQP